MPERIFFVLLVAVCFAACTQGPGLVPDINYGTDTDVDTDADTDADGDADGDVDGDADSDADDDDNDNDDNNSDDDDDDDDTGVDADSDTDADSDVDGDSDADGDTDTDTTVECIFECMNVNQCNNQGGVVLEEMYCPGNQVCCDVGEDTDTGTETSTDTGTTEGDYWTDGYCGDYSNGIAASPDCKTITYEGCCDDDGHVIWCENEVLYCDDCESQGMLCTWTESSQGTVSYYACRSVESAVEDPSGENPLDCTEL